MTPLQNDPPTAPTRGETSKISRFARRETEPGFGICAPRALEIRSRFSFWSTKMRFHEQLRWGHHGGGTNVDPGPAKAQPVYYRNIIENPLSLALLGEPQAGTIWLFGLALGPRDPSRCVGLALQFILVGLTRSKLDSGPVACVGFVFRISYLL